MIRRFFSRFLDPDRSRLSRAILVLLAVSAWINNFLAFLFWGGVQLNNLGVWVEEPNLFWFFVLLVLAPVFIGLLGLFWQLLAIPLVLLLAIVYWVWAEAFTRLRGVEHEEREIRSDFTSQPLEVVGIPARYCPGCGDWFRSIDRVYCDACTAGRMQQH